MDFHEARVDLLKRTVADKAVLLKDVLGPAPMDFHEARLDLLRQRVTKLSAVSKAWDESQHPREEHGRFTELGGPGRREHEFVMSGHSNHDRFIHELKGPFSPQIREAHNEARDARAYRDSVVREGHSESSTDFKEADADVHASGLKLQELWSQRDKRIVALNREQAGTGTPKAPIDEVGRGPRPSDTGAAYGSQPSASEAARQAQADQQRRQQEAYWRTKLDNEAKVRQAERSAAQAASGVTSDDPGERAAASEAAGRYRSEQAEQAFRDEFSERTERQSAGGLPAAVANVAGRVARAVYLGATIATSIAGAFAAGGERDLIALGRHLTAARSDISSLKDELADLPQDARVLGRVASRNLSSAKRSLRSIKAKIAAAREDKRKAASK